MSSKVTKLADTVRLAVRTYDSGKRETGIRLIGLVASKLATADERKALNRLVEADARSSQIWPYYQSILFGGGPSGVVKGSYPVHR